MKDEQHNAPPACTRPATGSLPLQNMLLAAVVIGGVGGMAMWLDTQTGFPFGRRALAPAGSPVPAAGSSAGLMLAHIIALLSARGVAKALLHPRKHSDHYGYWLLALSALLGALPLVGLDLLATQVTHWWNWETGARQWQGIALPNLPGWLLVNTVALLLATPALIDKRPNQPPPESRPLVVWFALNAVCLGACVSRASDAAVAVLAALVLAVTMLAFQQHRRASASFREQA